MWRDHIVEGPESGISDSILNDQLRADIELYDSGKMSDQEKSVLRDILADLWIRKMEDLATALERNIILRIPDDISEELLQIAGIVREIDTYFGWIIAEEQ